MMQSDGSRWFGGFTQNLISLSIVRTKGNTAEFTKLHLNYLIFVACGLAVKTKTLVSFHSFNSMLIVFCSKTMSL